MTFSRVLGTFGTPYFLGAPVRYFTLATTIYTSIVNRTPAVAYIGALVLILISMVIIYFNQRLIGDKSFVTIAGKGLRRRLTPLGARKQLLIAESELNRARLVEDAAAFTTGVKSATTRVRSVGSIASSAAVLLASLVALRPSRTAAAGVSPVALGAVVVLPGAPGNGWLR